MKINIWGGTGYAGRNIAAEAARRGHEVTVLSRKGAAEQIAGVTYEQASVLDAAARARSLDADIVVVALSPRGDMADAMRPAVQQLIVEATAAGTRLAVVGGAGSLLVAEGGPRAVDTDQFPAEYKAEALALGGILDDLRASDASLDWFFVSPASIFGGHTPGEATGRYRVGGDISLNAADGGPSFISGADFALAFVDEIEQNAHNRARFTVAN